MPLPAYVVRPGFLEEAECEALLAWAIAREGDFEESTLKELRVTSSYRQSRTLAEIGPWKELFRQRLAPLVPGLLAALGIPAFEPAKFELQMAAHNDGGFYKRHLDIWRGPGSEPTVRVLSLVYYFFTTPPAFTGGALRMYSFVPGSSESIDIQPTRNTLVAFPSWAPHEVLPIACETGRFADSRFAINCWVRRAKPAAADQPQ